MLELQSLNPDKLKSPLMPSEQTIVVTHKLYTMTRKNNWENMQTKTGVKLGNQLNSKGNLHSHKCHEPQHLWLMHRCGKVLKTVCLTR